MQLTEELYQHCEPTFMQDEKENDHSSSSSSPSSPQFISWLKDILENISSQVTKLRVENKLEKGKKDELSRLLVFLSKNLISRSAETNLRTTDKALLSTEIERVGIALEASLIALQVMTTEGLPKTVTCIEEVQDNVFKLAKFQLTHSIIPALEEADSLDGMCEETKEALMKAEGKSKKNQNNKNTSNKKKLSHLIQKLTEILERVTAYVSKFKPTELLIDHVVSMTLPIFFVTGLSQMQLNAMNALRAIFSKYPDQRDCILQDISSSWIKLPAGKRNLQHREYKTYNSSIQMVTALVLQLLQSCASLSSIATSASSSIDLEPSSTETIVVLGEEHRRNPYEEVKRLSVQFAARFLHKCAKNPTEDDYRPIVRSFVKDLLTVVCLPEWPAAEPLLEATYHLLIDFMEKKDYPAKIKAFFLGLLGTVAAKTHMEQANIKKDECFFSPSPKKNFDLCSICEKTTALDSGILAVDCSRCQRTFHESCADFKEEDEEESATWLCGFCSIYLETSKQVSEAKKRHEKDNMDMEMPSLDEVDDPDKEEEKEEVEVDERDHEDVLRQMLINYLTKEAKNDHSISNSLQFAVVQWLYGGEKVDEKTVQLWATSSSYSSSSPSSRVAQREIVMKIARFLARERSLIKDSFLNIMSRLSKEIRSEAPTSRSKALKALAEIALTDPSVLAEDSVMTCIKNRTQDVKVSVREAAVDLVGTFMLGEVELKEEYLNIVKERSYDTGLSVRKKVVNILKEFCVKNPNSPHTTSIFKTLASRLSDEESVKKIVLELFAQCWFTLAPLPKSMRSSSSYSVDQTETLQVTAAQIVAVMEVKTSTDWFVGLLEELMKRKNGHKQIEKICTQLCDCLVQNVLAAGEVKEEKQATVQLSASLITLGAICKVAPHLLVRHINTIAHYLLHSLTNFKADPGCVVTGIVVQMLEQVLPKVENPCSKFLEQVEKDLQKVIGEIRNYTVLPCAVKCVCVISEEVTNRLDYIDSLLSFPLKFLEAKKEEQKKPNTVWTEGSRKSMSRTLLIVSLLCRYHDFDSRNPPKIEGLKPQLQKGKVLQRIFELCKGFALLKYEDLRLTAVQALGHIYIRDFKLILGSKDIITRVLTEKTNDSKLQAQILTNFAEFLREDKARRQSLHGGKDGLSGNKKKDTDEVDSVSVVSKYLPQILSIAIHPKQDIRAAALSTLDCIIRQGLVNPQQCVGHVLAFGTDPLISISTKAQQLFEYLNLNQHQFVMQQLGEGLKFAHQLQKSVVEAEKEKQEKESEKGKEAKKLAERKACGMAEREPGVWESRFTKYYDANRKPYSERRKFITNVLKTFEVDLTSDIDLSLLKFAAETIVSLPFSVADEPLFTIHSINGIIARKAAVFLADLKSAIEGSKGGAMISSSSHSASSPAQSAIANVAKASLAMWLLLLAKRLLKKGYHLSEVKCQGYSQNDKAAQTQAVRIEKETMKPEAFGTIFEKVLDPQNWNNLLWKECYKGFKRMMGEDDGEDYNKLHALKPTRGRKPGSGVGVKKTAKRKNARREADDEEELEDEEAEVSTVPTKKRKTLQRTSKRKAASKNNDDGYCENEHDEDYH